MNIIETFLMDASLGEASKKDEFDGPNEWLKIENQFHPAKDTKKVNKVEPGFYTIGYNQGQYFAVREDLTVDEIYKLPIPGFDIDDMLDELSDFWDKKELFKTNKITHKRGILLVGEPGTGKSSLINLISKQVVNKGGVVFHISNANELGMLITFMSTTFRCIEPDTPVITIIEDVDNLVSQDEHMLLSFLDGEDQIEHNITIATSNRVQELNDLLMRPSRFDWIIQIDKPEEDARKLYFTNKGLSEDEAQEWAKKTDGLSMAHLKEIFISVKLLDSDFEDVKERLENQDGMIENKTYTPKPRKDRDGNGGLGFNFKNKLAKYIKILYLCINNYKK